MHPIRLSTLVISLLLLAYLLYSFNMEFSQQELIVEEQIQNLTQNYLAKKTEMSQFYADKIATLQQELLQLKTESKIKINNLDSQFQNQKYYMNTTLYKLHHLYLPAPLKLNWPELNS